MASGKVVNISDKVTGKRSFLIGKDWYGVWLVDQQGAPKPLAWMEDIQIGDALGSFEFETSADGRFKNITECDPEKVVRAQALAKAAEKRAAGATPTTKGRAPVIGRDSATNRSIELQTVVKAVGDIMHGFGPAIPELEEAIPRICDLFWKWMRAHDPPSGGDES